MNKKKVFLIIVIILAVFVVIRFKANHKSLKTEIADSQELVDAEYEYVVQENGVLFSSDDLVTPVSMYYDFERNESYVLCSKAGCNHMTENCPAAKNSSEEGTYIYNGALWHFVSADGRVTLVKSNIDGTEKKECLYIDARDYNADSCYYNAAFYSGGDAYVIIYFENYDSQCEKGAVIHINLEDGEKKYLFELGTYDIMQGIYANHALIMTDNVYPPLSESEYYSQNGSEGNYDAYRSEWISENGSVVFSSVDLDSGNVNEIAVSHVGTDYDTGKNFINGRYYYVDGNTLYYIDMNDMESHMVYEDIGQLSMQCSSGNYVFLLRLDDTRSNRQAFLCYDLKKQSLREFDEDIFGGSGAWFMDCTEDYVIGSKIENLINYQYFVLPMESAVNGSRDGMKVFKSVVFSN